MIDIANRGMLLFKFDESLLDISGGNLSAPGMGLIKIYSSSGWMSVVPGVNLTNTANTFSFTGMTNPPFNDPAASYAIKAYTWTNGNALYDITFSNAPATYTANGITIGTPFGSVTGDYYANHVNLY